MFYVASKATAMLVALVALYSVLAFAQPGRIPAVPSPWDAYYSPPRVPYLDGTAAPRDPLAGLDNIGNVPSPSFHTAPIATSLLNNLNPCTDCAVLNPKIDSIAPDDFGFSELQKEQEELHKDSMIVMQQKNSIQAATMEVKKFQAKLESDKETLADNQRNLKKWTEEMINHVNAYKEALMEAQEGIGTGGAGGEEEEPEGAGAAAPSSAAAPPAAAAGAKEPAKEAAPAKDAAPKFRALRDDVPSSAHGSLKSLFNKLQDFKITAEQLERHLPEQLQDLKIKRLSKPNAKLY